MLREAIQTVQAMEQANANSRHAKVFTVPSEPGDVYFLQTFDEKGVADVRRHVAEPKPRAYNCTTLTGMAQIIEMFEDEIMDGEGDDRKPGECGRVVVFVSRGCVTAVMGERERRHTAWFRFDTTEAIQLLAKWEHTPAKMNQADLLFMLRSTFSGLAGPADAIAALRTLKWRSRSDGSAVVAAGRSSLGADIEREVVAGDGEIPQELVLHAHVYQGLEEIREKKVYTLPFRVAFDVDFATQQFVLKTLPDQVVAAQNEADQMIVEFLSAHVHWSTEVILGGQFNPPK